MAFQFPDPQTTSEFTADNGITYAWDVDDSKWQVKTTAALDDIRQDIIELEEEIDALAPSLERGKWTFTAVGTVANPGQFTMYDDEFGSGQPTGLFKSAKSIWFNEIDSDGAPHAFADVDDGELLEIFVDGSPEYGLYEVVGQAHDETQGAASFWVIDVNFVRTLSATTAVGPGELCRFKIFTAPTGGVDATTTVSLNSGSGGAKWNKDALSQPNNSYIYFGIEVAGSSIASINSGNILYLNKLRDCEGVRQDLRGYTPTGDSFVEVYKGNELYFKSQLKASTYKVADRNPTEIECQFCGNYPIVSKPSTSWDTSTYRFIVTGLQYTGINKGNTLKYTFDNSVGDAVSNPGEIGTNTGFWSSVNKFSFGTADADGTTTSTMVTGSTIETYNAKENKTNIYTVTNAASAPTAVEVQYISGDYFYTVGDELEVNIY